MIAVQAVLDGSETTQTIRHLPTLVVRQSTRHRALSLSKSNIRYFDGLRTR